MKLLSIRFALILAAAVTAALSLSALPTIAQDAPPAEDEATEPKSANDPGYVLKDRPGQIPKGGKQCIYFRRLYDWQPLNDTNLIVWAPSRKFPYHIQLARRCHGLRFTLSLGFFSRDSNLCPFGGDAVLVDSGGGRPERCSIAAITKLSEEALKSLQDQAPGRQRRDKDKDDNAAEE
jgi:hypothetical protein